MAINLTEKQYLMLSQLAYIELPIANQENFGHEGKTLKQISDYIISKAIDKIPPKGGLDSEQFKQLLETIKSDSVLSELTLMDYENNNAENKDGFVGYAFKNKDGDRVQFDDVKLLLN